MKEGPDIAFAAALIGDPARANMLAALMGGQALTASELAAEAGVTQQTASAHLAKLADGGLLRVRKQGRHKYFALASDTVAQALEALMHLSATTRKTRLRPGPKDPDLRRARVCYDHLAGEMGVQMYQSLVARDLLAVAEDGLTLTAEGADFMRALGVDLTPLQKARAPLCRECLDWSVRKSHLAGSLGRALLATFETNGWARRVAGSRVITFTPTGQRQFARLFPAAKPPSS